jgi:hypothetical protein
MPPKTRLIPQKWQRPRLTDHHKIQEGIDWLIDWSPRHDDNDDDDDDAFAVMQRNSKIKIDVWIRTYRTGRPWYVRTFGARQQQQCSPVSSIIYLSFAAALINESFLDSTLFAPILPLATTVLF